MIADTPVIKLTNCAFCLTEIDIGEGDVAHFGVGNTKPFHILCLKKLLPFIGHIFFDSSRAMYLQKNKIVEVENDMDRDRKEVEMVRIVMDGSLRLRTLECLIRNDPLPDECFRRKGTRTVKGGTRVVKEKREKKVEKVTVI